jgi:hypothetical protein
MVALKATTSESPWLMRPVVSCMKFQSIEPNHHMAGQFG